MTHASILHHTRPYAPCSTRTREYSRKSIKQVRTCYILCYILYIVILIVILMGSRVLCYHVLPCATLGFRLVDTEDIERRVVSCRVVSSLKAR